MVPMPPASDVPPMTTAARARFASVPDYPWAPNYVSDLPALDGLRLQWVLGGWPLELVYRVGPRGCGPLRLLLDGTELAFEREPNPYRTGGAAVARAALEAALQGGSRTLVIELG